MLETGQTCSVGTGLSDAERSDPPPVGSKVTIEYDSLTKGGYPRFPVFKGIRFDT